MKGDTDRPHLFVFCEVKEDDSKDKRQRGLKSKDSKHKQLRKHTILKKNLTSLR